VIHTLLITPARPGRFDARLDGSDQFLVEGSRTPFCDAARALLAASLAHADDILVMRHAGSAHDALRARIDVAAKLTVDETSTPRFHKWTDPSTRGYANSADTAPPMRFYDQAATYPPAPPHAHPGASAAGCATVASPRLPKNHSRAGERAGAS
jgi:hypothetical protein